MIYTNKIYKHITRKYMFFNHMPCLIGPIANHQWSPMRPIANYQWSPIRPIANH